MNEKQATEKGYRYTGIYSRDIEEVKNTRDVRFRDKGYKAVLVTKKDSAYSRGPRGVGYSIYAEEKYFVDLKKQMLKTRLLTIPAELVSLQAEFEQAQKKLYAEAENLQTELKALEEKNK
jgi:hypothetical protein